MKERIDKLKYKIRPAVLSDVMRMYSLLRESFYNYLEFTPYLDPRSVNLIKQDIINYYYGPKLINQWKILHINDEILGLYCFKIIEERLFLNYIGIDKYRRGVGLGNYLLNEFENDVNNYNLRSLGLEVFKSNKIAYTWYKSKGYNVFSLRYLNKIKIIMNENEWPRRMQLNEKETEEALKKEEENGFSILKAKYCDEEIVLGLIGSQYCKLIRPKVCKDLILIKDLMCYFSGKRKYLIVGTIEDIKDKFIIDRIEISFEMRKELQ